MSKFKTLFAGLVTAALLSMPAVSASASVVVDPSVGGSYDFE